MPIEINHKYKPLWETDCFITLVVGGRASGKSYAVGDFIENLSFEQGHKILFTRYTLYSAADSIIPEFEEKIELEGHSDFFYIIKSDIKNIRSGTEILFRGIKTSSGNQTAKLKSIEGLTTWVLDEAEELTEEKVFNVIMQSIRKKGIQNRIIILMNAVATDHWIYQRFFEKPNVDPEFNGEANGVCYIKTTYLDNLDNLSNEFLSEAEKCKTESPVSYGLDYLGKWMDFGDGGIFKKEYYRYFSMQDILNLKATHGDEAIWDFVIDTAFTEKKINDPTGIIAYSHYHGKMYIRNAQSVYMELPDLIEFINNFCITNGYSNQSSIFIEPKASGHSTEQMLRKYSALNVQLDKPPVTDKLSRARGTLPFMESGRCHLLSGSAWIDEFITQTTLFPNAPHDEYVDLLSMSIDKTERPTGSSILNISSI